MKKQALIARLTELLEEEHGGCDQNSCIIQSAVAYAAADLKQRIVEEQLSILDDALKIGRGKR